MYCYNLMDDIKRGLKPDLRQQMTMMVVEGNAE